MGAAVQETGEFTAFPQESFTEAAIEALPWAARDNVAGITVSVDALPGTTVTVALPVLPPADAVTVTLPREQTFNTPEVLIAPVVVDQTNVTLGTTLFPESRAWAVKDVRPADTFPLPGVTTMVCTWPLPMMETPVLFEILPDVAVTALG